jgi:pimeloyl-ACP methyl ester carboxylesterase
MIFSSFLDKWDEARAAEDDTAKLVENVTLGASLAFDEAPGHVELNAFKQLVLKQQDNAHQYYASARNLRKDFNFDGDLLTFPSAVLTETAPNNLVRARVRGPGKRRVAVVILPHWNAPAWSYHSFAGYFAKLGFTAVEVTLPYHGLRTRNASLISDYFLSPNLGRTIRSVRQSVIDTRDVITWLNLRGHDRVVLIGLSLGSCIAGLVAAHDPRVTCSALVLTAGDFAEVVWTGRATRHIRRALEPEMTLDELGSVWSIISTGTFAKELARKGHRTLIISGTRDTVVKPYLTQRFIEQLQKHGAQIQWLQVGCGHYSLALPPFNVTTFARLLYFFRDCGLFKRS